MTQDELKKAVAQAALDYVLPKLAPSSVLGIGTGTTANFFIDMLAQSGCAFAGAIASSNASEDRLTSLGIPILDLNQVDQVAFYIDGADESNPELCLIKGGGAALTREKIVAAVAEQFICIADQSKWVETLGRFPLPVEIIPMARSFVTRELKKLGGNPIYREGVITDNGGDILDVFDLDIHSPQQMETTINQITGVIANGLFALRPADVLLLGTEHGVKLYTR